MKFTNYLVLLLLSVMLVSCSTSVTQPHMVFLDGVFTTTKHNQHNFVRTKAPTLDELNQLVHTLSHRVARYLERQGHSLGQLSPENF